MAGDDDNERLDSPGAFPTPPGFTTQPFGPLGVPVPVPDDGTTDGTGAEEPVGPEPDPEPDDEAPIGTGGQDELREAAEAGQDYLDRVEAAIDKETCGFCANILRQLRGRPLEEQVEGVQELAELKEFVKDNPDQEAIEERMEDFEVLSEPSNFM